MLSSKEIDSGSFRDPSGFIYCQNGKVFRHIKSNYFNTYHLLVEKGIYNDLINKNLLIKHTEVEKTPEYITLEVEKIPFISYPYEWCFSQLKDAALLTLKLEKELLLNNFSLKDASAYNVQFLGYQPIFIDTLSIEEYIEGPWAAFGQFCRHFLYPLMLMSKVNLNLNALLKNWIDGIPGDVVDDLLPNVSKYFSLNYWLYIKLQNLAQKKYQTNKKKINKTLNKKQLLNIIKGLYLTIESLKFPKSKTEWGNYYSFTNYTESSFTQKHVLVNDFINQLSPKEVWDLGANNGEFSRLASNKGIPTIAFDIDPIAIEKNYLIAKKQQEKLILPLLLNLTNPSSGIGWANKERISFFDRGPTDCGLILALIHHLAIGNNIPFAFMAEYFSKLFNSIIIEFIPKEDSKVQELLLNRKDVFLNYSQNSFEEAFKKYFEIKEKVVIEGSIRTLYLMKKII